MTVRIVVTAYPSMGAARREQSKFLRLGLAACVKISQVQSSYRWNGKIESKREFVLNAVTSKKKCGRLVKEIKKGHPYDTPEVMEIRGKADRKYDRWVESC